jgi:hypothetical protein
VPRVSSPEVDRVCGQIAQLERVLVELRTKFGDEHPRVRLVEERLKELKVRELHRCSA